MDLCQLQYSRMSVIRHTPDALLVAPQGRLWPSSVNCSSRSFQSAAAVQGAFSRSTERRLAGCCLAPHGQYDEIGRSGATRSRGQLG